MKRYYDFFSTMDNGEPNNKTVYDNIRNIMRQLETGE
jgi:hypothetical protein